MTTLAKALIAAGLAILALGYLLAKRRTPSA